jgi:hypothetical protein
MKSAYGHLKTTAPGTPEYRANYDKIFWGFTALDYAMDYRQGDDAPVGWGVEEEFESFHVGGDPDSEEEAREEEGQGGPDGQEGPVK